ncbi:MAG: hypothetical protein H7330_01890 [Hymenobacteraceae bacterium]|nr:hypothetical protein [Hymenobacteraceae bacterium]
MPPSLDPLAQLTEIRAIMERSSRFLSLSGLAGVGVGVVALVGAGVAHAWLAREFGPGGFSHLAAGASPLDREAALPFLVGLAVLMITVGLLVAFFFTRRRAARTGQAMWGAAARRLTLSLLVPLVAGGLFALALYEQGALGLVVPALLLFYGLALLSASKYTLDEIRGLGYVQVALGLVGLLLPTGGLWLFAAGFGVAHIAYGVLMFNRYERDPRPVLA